MDNDFYLLDNSTLTQLRFICAVTMGIHDKKGKSKIDGYFRKQCQVKELLWYLPSMLN